MRFGLAAAVAALAACGHSPGLNNTTGTGNTGGNTTGGGTAGGTSSGGTSGGMVCGTCFLHGRWQVDNYSPCFLTATDLVTVTAAASSSLSGAVVTCPMDFTVPPSQPWATDTLTVDCPGHYRLCITLKAGDSRSPQPGDCTMAQTCAQGDYADAGQPQPWTDVPSWLATATEIPCAQRFFDDGGYAELSVSGSVTGCGSVARTFGWVRYCPLSCNANPSDPACVDCGAGDLGTF
jgi:hypothetical protein